MSSSESETFNSLITQGEENFWKTFEVMQDPNKSDDDNASPETQTPSHRRRSKKSKKKEKEAAVTENTEAEVPTSSTETVATAQNRIENMTINDLLAIPSTSSNDGTPVSEQAAKSNQKTAVKRKPTPPRPTALSLLPQLDNATNVPSTDDDDDLPPMIHTVSPRRPEDYDPWAMIEPPSVMFQLAKGTRRSPRKKRRSNRSKSNSPQPSPSNSWPVDLSKEPPRNSAPEMELDPEILNSYIDFEMLENNKTPRCESSPSLDEINKLEDVVILWKSLHRKIFKIRRFTKMAKIVDYFVKLEKVPEAQICFYFRDEEVDLREHSCVTLMYFGQDEISGSILPTKAGNVEKTINRKPTEDSVRFHIQHMKQRAEVWLQPDVKLEHLYAQVVIKFNLPIGTFNVFLDGERVFCSRTIRDLKSVEEDDCFDVHLVNGPNLDVL